MALALTLTPGAGAADPSAVAVPRHATITRATAAARPPGGAARPPGAAARPPIVRATAAEVLARVRAPGARATLVNVWATWCVPCREEFPALLAVARAHRDDGVRVILVSADFADELPAVRRFLVARGVADTCLLKRGGDMEFINTLHPEWSGAMPATLVYDTRGRRTAFWEGAADSARFEGAIQRALAGSTP